jgi:hypothetical protein
MIYVILSFTAFFFAALLALTLFSYGDLPELTTTR